jgi:hypothetical protein
MNKLQFRLRILFLALCIGIFSVAVYKKLTEVSVKLPQTVSDSPIIVKPTNKPYSGGAG